MNALGLADNLAMFERVAAAYAEPHRHYHTAAHIDACLCEFDAARSFAASPAEVELALWFHDVVYMTRISGNERRSADAASRFLTSANAASGVAARVHAHVMATTHDVEPLSADSRLVADVDLAILGKDAKHYDAFEHGVRAEYDWVPWPVYRAKRAAILRSFLERPLIYWTEPFRHRYEAPARANLERAIGALAG